MDLVGFEPGTLALPVSRVTNCAILTFIKDLSYKDLNDFLY